MKRLFYILILFLVLSGCGSGGGDSDIFNEPNETTTPTQTTDPVTVPNSNSGPPAAIVISSSVPSGTLLSQGGQATILATVQDSEGNLVEDGTLVRFTASAGTITASSATTNGIATASFQAGNTGGIVEIIASSGEIFKTATIEVAAGDASTVTVIEVTPEKIGVKGSGIPEVATLTFKVLDDGGNPVNDGTIVDFKLITALGGEKLDPLKAETISGIVSTTLISGTVSGIAAVNATVQVDGLSISTEAKITISAGKPDSNHLGIASEKIYLAGYDTYGLESKVTAYLADRYSNPVPMDTPVYFATEGGTISLQDANGTSTNFTNGYGQASGTLITTSPLPETPSSVTGTKGINTIIAFTEGHEAFVDLNGNGTYDEGEPFDDLGEPFIDANDNGSWDAVSAVANEERFIDANGNGQYDGPNNQREKNKLIWVEMRTVFSNGPPVINITPSSFSVPDDGFVDLTVTIEDANGNSLPEGSKLTVSCSGGRLLGLTSWEYPAIGPLEPITTFPYTIEDENPGDTNAPENATFTVSIDSPLGKEILKVYGTVD